MINVLAVIDKTEKSAQVEELVPQKSWDCFLKDLDPVRIYWVNKAE